MTKATRSHVSLPQSGRDGLAQLGRDLSLARRRRRIPVRRMAERMRVSPTTVTRLERGDPGVSMGVLMTALWLFGMQNRLATLVAPESDAVGQRASIEATPRHAVAPAGRDDDDPDF